MAHDGDSGGAAAAAPGRYARFRAVMARNPMLNTVWRAGVFVVGVAVLIAGVVMIVAPGPGILGVILGLAILATEFAWAQAALHRAKAAAEKAKEKAKEKARRK